MNDEIFYQAKTAIVPESSIEVRNYTLLGNHDFIDEDDLPRTNENKALAKTIIANNRKKYMIKVGAYGKIFNPLGLHSEGRENKFLSKIGKNEWNFKEVNLKIFEMYLNFLKSRNIAWLNNAQRELI
jgi:hypothetical protein